MTWRPKRAFRVGAMRERITLQSLTETIDDHGQAIKSWANLDTNVPARYEPMTGNESIRDSQVEANVNTIFVIRYRNDLNVKMRVLYDSQTYGIVHVKRVEGGKRYIELHCKADVD